VSDHISSEDLHGLLTGSLDKDRVRQTVAHLLGGCAGCRSAMVLAAQAPLRRPFPRNPQSSEIPADLDAAYEGAIQRALETARRKRGGARPQEPRPAGTVEALLQRSWELRQDDPQEMLRCALLATIEAGKLDPEPLGAAWVEDVRCRAALELGNAYRVANRLQEAEDALGEAVERFRQGTGDDRLKARLLDVQASLYGDLRYFDLCFAALDAVIALYRELGESHLVGRALITKAVHTRYANDTPRAIDLLQEGLSLIDPEADPKLAVNSVHNLAWLMVDCGRYREARRILWESLPHNGEHVGHLDRLKARWLEGRVNAGLGKLALAERDLQAAREGLEAAGLPYTAAIAALDLAELELRRGQPEPAEALALQAVGVFLSLEIGREAQTAVRFLEAAAKRRLMTGVVLRDVADFLRYAEGDPQARFEPAR
jgi:tetratricopeptide (TPR) repeat protein